MDVLGIENGSGSGIEKNCTFGCDGRAFRPAGKLIGLNRFRLLRGCLCGVDDMSVCSQDISLGAVYNGIGICVVRYRRSSQHRLKKRHTKNAAAGSGANGFIEFTKTGVVPVISLISQGLQSSPGESLWESDPHLNRPLPRS